MTIDVKIGKGGNEASFLAMQNISRTQKEFIDQMSFKRINYSDTKNLDFVSNPWSNPVPNI